MDQEELLSFALRYNSVKNLLVDFFFKGEIFNDSFVSALFNKVGGTVFGIYNPTDNKFHQLYLELSGGICVDSQGIYRSAAQIINHFQIENVLLYDDFRTYKSMKAQNEIIFRMTENESIENSIVDQAIEIMKKHGFGTS